MWYLHDGTAPQFSRALLDVLSRRTHSMTSTLSRLESSGFLPVGTRKSRMSAVTLDNEEVFHHCSVDVCQIIRNCPGIFERMRRSMMRRVEACTESNGRHFEQL
jgi:hypothetical protein